MFRPGAMLPSASAGLGYCEINAFHLAQGQQPPDLHPQAHYTYDELKTLRQVQTDINQNLCIQSRIHSWAIWIEPMPIDGSELPPGDNPTGSDTSPPEALTDDGAHDLAMDAGSIPVTTTEDTSAPAGGRAPETPEADSAPGDADHVVPPHPNQALFDLALTRHQLPAPQQREFQEGLAQILAKATETYMLTKRDSMQHVPLHGHSLETCVPLTCSAQRDKHLCSETKLELELATQEHHHRAGTELSSSTMSTVTMVFLDPTLSWSCCFWP